MKGRTKIPRLILWLPNPNEIIEEWISSSVLGLRTWNEAESLILYTFVCGQSSCTRTIVPLPLFLIRWLHSFASLSISEVSFLYCWKQTVLESFSRHNDVICVISRKKCRGTWTLKPRLVAGYAARWTNFLETTEHHHAPCSPVCWRARHFQLLLQSHFLQISSFQVVEHHRLHIQAARNSSCSNLLGEGRSIWQVSEAEAIAVRNNWSHKTLGKLTLSLIAAWEGVWVLCTRLCRVTPQRDVSWQVYRKLASKRYPVLWA
jgi:hypothetical protein